MRNLTYGFAIASVAAMTLACNQQPYPEIDAANTAMDRARVNQAPQFASERMREAEQAKAELEREMEAQSQAWFKSYDRARELALETKAAAELALTDAMEARETAYEVAAAGKKKAAAEDRVASAVSRDAMKIKDVAPVYPAIAKTAGVEGTVTLAAAIDAKGNVTGTSVVRSVPMLNKAAIDAVREWQYQPKMVRGKAVPSTVVVDVKFVRS